METVYLVEDDKPVRRALTRLLNAAGFETQEFESGDELMNASINSRRACLVAESEIPSGAGSIFPDGCTHPDAISL